MIREGGSQVGPDDGLVRVHRRRLEESSLGPDFERVTEPAIEDFTHGRGLRMGVAAVVDVCDRA